MKINNNTIQISYGTAAANGYIYLTADNKDSNINDPHAIIHQITYDYAFNSVYIIFNKQISKFKPYEIDLKKSIGEILEYRDNKWRLEHLNTPNKIKIFKRLLSAIIEKIKNKKYHNILEEIKKLNQILYLLN